MDEVKEYKLAENEMQFRSVNQQVQRRIQADYEKLERSGLLLRFYCECSNDACRERIVIAADEYGRAHKGEKYFIALPGHEVPSIEEVVETHPGYNVIRKYADPAKVTGRS